jgi:hypothetical protein
MALALRRSPLSAALLRAMRSAPRRRTMATAAFDWEDPLQLRSQLTEEETMVMVRPRGGGSEGVVPRPPARAIVTLPEGGHAPIPSIVSLLL